MKPKFLSTMYCVFTLIIVVVEELVILPGTLSITDRAVTEVRIRVGGGRRLGIVS